MLFPEQVRDFGPLTEVAMAGDVVDPQQFVGVYVRPERVVLGALRSPSDGQGEGTWIGMEQDPQAPLSQVAEGLPSEATQRVDV